MQKVLINCEETGKNVITNGVNFIISGCTILVADQTNIRFVLFKILKQQINYIYSRISISNDQFFMELPIFLNFKKKYGSDFLKKIFIFCSDS